MAGYIFLSSPYTPIGVDDPVEQAVIREERFQAASKAAAHLMRAGEVVLSPIAHSHPIDLYFDGPESGDFWARQDRPFPLVPLVSLRSEHTIDRTFPRPLFPFIVVAITSVANNDIPPLARGLLLLVSVSTKLNKI